MKPKATWLVAASITALTVITASSLRGTSQQVWNPKVARAANVTVNLFKGKVITPVQLARTTRTTIKTTSSFSGLAPSNEIIGYTLNQRFPLTETPNALGRLTHPIATFRRSLSPNSSKLPIRNGAIAPQDLAPNRPTFQNWDDSVESTLKQQNYQIKKLEFELAKERYKTGKIDQTTFDQKSGQYRLANQEFKAFLESSKMTSE